MAELAREDAPAAVEPSAPGKRHLEQTTNPQAELPKRARTSESADEAAPEPEDARPSESAGDEAEPQDDEAAPQTPNESRVQFSLFLVHVRMAGVDDVRRFTPNSGRMTYKAKKCQKNEKKDC